jgi:hypothetical protein
LHRPASPVLDPPAHDDPHRFDRKMATQRLTVGHRDLRNPRCGFELINVAANFRLGGALTVMRRVAALLAMTIARRKAHQNA